MSTKQPSTSVFVGNIPYGLTEEQIIDIFSQAGKVLSFRLVYDRETGRPKGFGFAEYPDADSAASAVRNLNDYEVMNRKLRVDFSNDGGEDDSAAPAGYQHPPMPSNGVPVPPPSQNGSSLPPLPIGIDLPPGLTCPDAISRTLNTLPPTQLLDVLSQMKALVTNDTAKAVELLRQAPQLSYAIFQALLLMGLVSTDALATVVEQSSANPGTIPPTSIPQAAAPQQHGQYGPPTVPGQAYAAAYPPAQSHLGGQIGTPPTHGLGYLPSQSQPYQQPPPAAGPKQDTDDLVTQVMNMPQSVLDMLPPAEKAQLEALRASFAGQAR